MNETATSAVLLWLMAISADLGRIADRSDRPWVRLLGSVSSFLLGMGATVVTVAYLWKAWF